MKKGSHVYVEGKLRTEKYTDKSGVEKYSTDIIADEMQMLGSKMSGGEGGGGGSSRPMGGGAPRSSGGGYGGGSNESRGGSSNQMPPSRNDDPFPEDDIPF